MVRTVSQGNSRRERPRTGIFLLWRSHPVRGKTWREETVGPLLTDHESAVIWPPAHLPSAMMWVYNGKGYCRRCVPCHEVITGETCHCHRQTSRDVRRCMAPGSDAPRSKVDTVVANANGLFEAKQDVAAMSDFDDVERSKNGARSFVLRGEPQE